MAIGNRIYELRKTAGMSQETLAEKLDVSRQTIYKWESGQSIPELNNILAISELFNISTDFLMALSAHYIKTEITTTFKFLPLFLPAAAAVPY